MFLYLFHLNNIWLFQRHVLAWHYLQSVPVSLLHQEYAVHPSSEKSMITRLLYEHSYFPRYFSSPLRYPIPFSCLRLKRWIIISYISIWKCCIHCKLTCKQTLFQWRIRLYWAHQVPCILAIILSPLFLSQYCIFPGSHQAVHIDNIPDIFFNIWRTNSSDLTLFLSVINASIVSSIG